MSNVGGAGGGPVATPDPVSLTARGRYDALFERLMRAGAEGDSATVANLAPQASAAYAALDSLDADARFHAGLIAIQTGDFSGARALADTLEGRDPGHLFGPVLRAVLARLDGDAGGYRAALLQFRQRAGRELARTDRPEYLEHRQLLTEVQHAAESQ